MNATVTTFTELKDVLKAKIAAAEGDVITVSSAAAEQMKSITNLVMEQSQFDPTHLTDTDVEVTKVILDMFGVNQLNGEVVDNTIIPVDEDQFEQAVEELRNLVCATDHYRTMALSCLLTQTALEELNYTFRR